MSSNLDDTFSIRMLNEADIPALAQLHVDTFNETHGNHSGGPNFESRQMQWKQIFQASNPDWFCIGVEKDEEHLVGFAKGQPYNHPIHSEFQGELNKIYLLREYQRFGLGRKLVCNVAGEFIQRSINSMLLFGDARNPSNGFYERMGAEKLLSEKGEFHGGYGWKDLHLLIHNSCGDS